MSKSIARRLLRSIAKKALKSKELRAELLELVDRVKLKELNTGFIHGEFMPGTIVVIRGFYYSGSSVLTGMFQEFDGVTTYGYVEPGYCRDKIQASKGETTFFLGTKFCEMVNSFRTGTPQTQDYYIKSFLHKAQLAYQQKGTLPWEFLPQLYNEYYKQILKEFIFSILELDEATRQKMQDSVFPFVYDDTSSHQYDGCSFMKGDKVFSRYLFYSFREMSGEEFDDIVATFLKKFFSILCDTDIVVYDQLLPNDYLDTVNYFLKENPIKQVCVYRDPRDMFISALRADGLLMARDIDGYEQFYRNLRMLDFSSGLERCMAKPNPHRLMIRYEDMVLKYDETVKKVLDFLGIDASLHVRPQSVFDPSISVNTIGAHKLYHCQDFIRQIEERLGEYCYDPEQESLSDKAWTLLESTGNWKRPQS